MLNPRTLASLAGAALIVFGTILVAFQILRQPPKLFATKRSADVSFKRVKLETTYPGLIMIGIGAVLMLASLIG